jgi:heme exporter protein A
VSIHLTGSNLKKVYNRRVIFDGISCSLGSGETLLVTGRNGSGKSTLVKIIAHVLTPTAGRIEIHSDSSPSYMLIGFVAPYLRLYDEFTARENIQFALDVRGLRKTRAEMDRLLDRVTLGRFRETPTRVFSSGMLQRLKFAFALCNEPPILILDEPMSNLDGEGREIVREIMHDQARMGILVVATNERSDVDRFSAEVNLNGLR